MTRVLAIAGSVLLVAGCREVSAFEDACRVDDGSVRAVVSFSTSCGGIESDCRVGLDDGVQLDGKASTSVPPLKNGCSEPSREIVDCGVLPADVAPTDAVFVNGTSVGTVESLTACDDVQRFF